MRLNFFHRFIGVLVDVTIAVLSAKYMTSKVLLSEALSIIN